MSLTELLIKTNYSIVKLDSKYIIKSNATGNTLTFKTPEATYKFLESLLNSWTLIPKEETK